MTNAWSPVPKRGGDFVDSPPSALHLLILPYVLRQVSRISFPCNLLFTKGHFSNIHQGQFLFNITRFSSTFNFYKSTFVKIESKAYFNTRDAHSASLSASRPWSLPTSNQLPRLTFVYPVTDSRLLCMCVLNVAYPSIYENHPTHSSLTI